MTIGFNKPYLAGRELHFIADAIKREKISGDGYYTKCCHRFFEETYGFKKVLLTTSCTDALEMAALLLDIQPGDEVIIPSYTFVSSANAFILRGAKVVFADSSSQHPNMDATALRSLVSSRTKAIVVVHYAGIACDMDEIMALAEEFNLFVVEDAAQAINSFYKGRPLGSIGHLGCLSFHETKNIICGEGGLLIINDERFTARAEIIWEKGTNRAAFFRGEVSKYNWMDIGSSFLASELNAAYLFGQLEQLTTIQKKRVHLWDYYYQQLTDLGEEFLPFVPSYSSNNAHCFYLTCKNYDQRIHLVNFLNSRGVQAIGHYLPLHLSDFFKDKHDNRLLINAICFSNSVVRLPLFYELTRDEQDFIIEQVLCFFQDRTRTIDSFVLLPRKAV